ncbi:MAG: zinc ribbon domain-containing protein [Candidatus Latescibacterota bacterium]
MKKCPFCAEDIQDEAIKCKHCGEFLDASRRPTLSKKVTRWYFRAPFIAFIACCLGPLALPLIWWRPETSRAWKIGLTLIILVVSWFLIQLTVESYRNIKEFYMLMEQL